MKFKEYYLIESVDYILKSKDENTFYADFIIGKNEFRAIAIRHSKDTVWNFMFGIKTDTGMDDKRIENENSVLTFKTVKKIFEEFLDKVNPEAITFGLKADKNNLKRLSIYHNYAKSLESRQYKISGQMLSKGNLFIRLKKTEVLKN